MEMKMEGEEGKKTIRLVCPSLAKVVQFSVWEEQRLDLGSIAISFGLDPASLKLNGHFIARGRDFIAPSVTWRSLFSFFSARGFSTGATDSDPLVVDGKLSKLGSKRMHDLTESRGEICNADHLIRGDSYPNKKLLFRDTDSCSKTRSKARVTGSGDQINEHVKRVKLSIADSGTESNNKDCLSGNTIWSGECSCSFSKIMKRSREDNLVVATSCKRTRL